MKRTNCYALFILLFLFSVIFWTSCVPRITKTSTFPQNINQKNEPTEIAQLVKESFKFYYKGQFTEAGEKLEKAIQIIPQEPTPALASLYSLLVFFHDKSRNIGKANLTSSTLQELLKQIGIKGDMQESDALALRFIESTQQLKPIDRIQYWERLRAILDASHGKSGEAFGLWQTGLAYIAINDYSKAYEWGIVALKLARESNRTLLELNASLVISSSLIGLARIHEAEDILRGVLPKTEGTPLLKANALVQTAVINGMLGHKEETVRLLQEAISITQSSGLTILEPGFRLVLGVIYLQTGKKEEGKREIMAALVLSEKLDNKFNLALSEISIANTFLREGMLEEAHHYSIRAADSYKILGMRIEEARGLRIAAQSLGFQNKIDEAIKLYERAALIQVGEKDRDGFLETLWSAVNILRSQGRIRDVRQVLLIGLNTYTSVFKDDVKEERRIRSELAQVYNELGLFSDALKQLMQVVQINDQLGDKKSKVLTLMELAQVFNKLNDSESRIQALLLAVELGSEIDDPYTKIAILNQAASLFQELGNPVEAFQRYLESINISKSLDKEVQHTQLGLLGLFYGQIGEYSKAIQHFEEQIRISKEINDQTGIAKAQVSISHCYLSMGKYDDAIQSALDSIKVLRGIKKDTIHTTGEITALNVISLALEYQGKYEDALKVQQERYEIAAKANNRLEIVNSYDRIGYIYLKLGKCVEAIENFETAIQMIELLRLAAEYEKYKITFLSKQLSPYDGIISAYYQLHRKSNSMRSEFAEKALNFAEMSKSRMLVRQLAAARARSIWEGVPIEIENEEIELLNKAITANEEYENALSRLGISARETEGKEKAKEIAYEQWNSFTEKMRRQYPKVDKFFFRFQAGDLAAIQLNELALKGQETLILFKVTPDWIYAWVVARVEDENKIIKFTQLPFKTSELERITKRLLLPYERGKYKEFDVNVSIELYDKIVRPLIERAEMPKRLIIVPDGILNVIPFEVLVTRKGCNNDAESPCYLGDEFTISYYPSAMILTLAREAIPKTIPMQGSLFAVGDPIYVLDDENRHKSMISFLQENEKDDKPDSSLRRNRLRKQLVDKGYSFERLKYSNLEVQKIRSIFENVTGDKEVLVGLDASEAQIKSRDLTKYQYLHFAVHGILAFDLPDLNEPALVLAVDADAKEDGFLTLSEIYKLKLNADLVTLSACKTGLGWRVSGEGVIGFSRAFMIAGARAVVVSLWEVDDHSTALFMEEFYKQLAQGVDKGEALVKAKQKLRKTGYGNPYFWGPFILVGE